MYLNADFFAAPFLDNKKFSSWARKQSGMKNFSMQLHKALETSKLISEGTVDLLKAYRVAIVGASILRTGEFSKKNCLLTGDSTLLFKVLTSHPDLARVIKSHMNCHFFDNWYSTQPQLIQQKRGKLLTKLELLVKSLDHDFERYQAKKLKAICSAVLPEGVYLHYHYKGHAVSHSKDGQQKPTEIMIENLGNHDISELKLLVDKFNVAQNAREIVRNPDTNAFSCLIQFFDRIQDKNFIDKFTANNDSDGIRLLKTTGYTLAVLLFGLGFYLSYKNKDTWKFWKSSEQELLDSTKENFDTQIKKI